MVTLSRDVFFILLAYAGVGLVSSVTVMIYAAARIAVRTWGEPRRTVHTEVTQMY